MIRINIISICTFALFGCSSYAAAVFAGSPNNLSSNDIVSWSQLGSDNATVPMNFTAISDGGTPVQGSLAGGSGYVSVVCPSAPSCSWTPATPPAFNAGDSLVYTNANGPLTLNFGGVYGAGLYIQPNLGVQFSAEIIAFAGASPVLAQTVASDPAGDPVFLGASDMSPEITAETFSIVSCTGCSASNVADFAVDTLFFNDETPVPEPTDLSLWSVGVCLVALLFHGSRKRRRISGPLT